MKNLYKYTSAKYNTTSQTDCSFFNEVKLNFTFISLPLSSFSVSVCLPASFFPSFPHGVIMVNKIQCKHDLVYIL